MAKMINKINFPNNLSDRKITFVKKDKTSKKKEGVVKTYTGLRKENLIRNNGKYAMYDKPLGMPIGLTTDVYHNENGKPQQIHKGGLLGYTYDVNGEYGKGLNDSYGRDVENVKHYSITNVKPTFSVNDYDKHGDYMSYVNNVYGTRETYAGHLMGLMGVRDVLDDVAIDILPNAESKTFADTINEILQYTDVQYAMEGEKVGIIRNIDVAKALGGVITTNVNNYSGKDTRLGMISNQLYAKTLSRAAHFNSLRRTKYITPELDRLYGNNLSNVYSLSSLFLLADGQPRLIEPVSDSFVKEYVGETIDEYLINFIPEYNEMQQEIQEWNGRNRYFGFSKSVESEEEISRRFNPNLVDEPKMVVSNMKEPSTAYRFYEEGDLSNGNAFNEKEFNALDGFKGETITIKKEGKDILNTTNKLFKNRLFDTLIGRFHTSNDKENTLSQSAVHPIFGLSKGRNLLTKNAWETGTGEPVNGYDNPYCRVWTYHNQYSKMKDLIRPFTDDDEFMGIDELQENWKIFRNHKGHERLAKNSVLNKNGMVNITPTNDLEVDVKQCMFSIENLAWKDINISGKGGYRFDNGDFVRDYQNTLSEEQRGPNGGRIMWFPPYDIDFQETSSADWHEDVFIGRGEPIYTYTNTKRSGSLSFTLLIDHPSVLNYWLLDKKNGDNIDNEQTLLRYFAGCEPIAPSEDVISSMLRGDYDGGDKNITPILPGEDIVFNVYFPNNYSGVDEEGGAEGALEMLFGGQYLNDSLYTGDTGTLEAFADSGETLFLGYEMGLNPIGTAFFKEDVETHLRPTYLTEVMNPNSDRMENYKEQEFVEVVKTGITKQNFFTEGSIYSSYNRKENASQKVKLEGEKTKLEEEKTELGTLVSELNNEYEKLNEELSKLSPGTVEYELLLSDIGKKGGEIYEKNKEIESKSEKIKSLEELIGLVDDSETKCISIFGLTSDTQLFIKTKPIYCFYKHTESDKTFEDDTEFDIDAKKAYAKYLLEKVEKYNNINEYYQKGLNQVVCRVKKNGKEEDYEYYASAISKKGDVVYDTYNTFENKREFDKSLWPFGSVVNRKGETKFYYKNQKGNIKESDSKEEQVRTLVMDGVLVEYANEQAFKDSGAICGFLEDENKYVYYESQKLDSKEKALQKIIDSLTEEDVEKAYENHMYGSYIEIQDVVDYWGIQYYCVYAKFVNGDTSSELPVGNYKTKQEYIIKQTFNNDTNNDEYCSLNKKEGGILELCFYKNNKKYKYYRATSHLENIVLGVYFKCSESYTEDGLHPESGNIDIIDFSNGEWYIHTIKGVDGVNGRNFSYREGRYYVITPEDDYIETTNEEVIGYFTWAEEHYGDILGKMSLEGLLEEKKSEGNIVIDVENNVDVSSEIKYYLDKTKKEYCYPHDNSTASQNLSAYNFVDLTSFGLNSTYEVAHGQDSSVTCSFGEFYAVTKEGNSGGTYTNFVLACEEAVLKARGVTGDTLNEKIEESKGRIQYIAECLEKYKEKITKVTVLGDASADGSAEGNDTLAKNRSRTLYDFLEGLEIGNVLTDETEGASNKQNNNQGNVSDLVKKKDRKVQTKIILGFDDTPESERSETERTNSIHAQKFKEEQKQYRRYDDERLFFSLLREKDSFAYTNLVKKVQYFSPAFHSITPEGFNARLTFLQQCTRQGPTITASEVGTSGSTAANLAFGRAPFCVLRLGDFLNTRIVVRSVNITYPDNMWDLNHDGIGAQFMMAKVTMNIDIIGGSDISAPIKRLQNAVSFNYYANTSIYDNRSDIAQYNGNGTSSDVRTWNPSLKPRQNGVATQTNS